MITTKHDKKANIITILKAGKFNINNGVSMLKKLVDKYGHLEQAYILEDSRETSYDISLSEVSDLLKAVKTHMAGFQEVRHADLVSSPVATAIRFIYAQLSAPITNYKYKAFSTEEAAIMWLKKGNYYHNLPE